MALSGIETLDLSPYVSAGIAAGPSLSGTGGVPLGQSLLNNQEFLQKAPALTPQIATELMQRAMVTGVPTYEFQPYGGFEAVKSAYDKGGGSYDLGKIAAPTLQNLASQVATSGVGNLAALERADIRLAPQAITAMQQSGIAPSTLSAIRALDIAPISTGYEYFAPSQVASARDFLSNKPTADQIYQRAAELKLSPSQTSSLLSLANKVDLKTAADAVNQYLKSTGKTLPGGFTTSVPDYYKSGIANLPTTGTTTGTTTGGTTGGISTLPGATDYNALVTQAYKDVLGRVISPTDPGFSYYLSQLQSGAIKPSDLASSIAYGSTSLADQLAAQKFLGKDIFGTEADLRSKYQTGFDQAITDVFGGSKDIEQLESLLSTKDRPFELSKALESKYFESAGSLEDIRKQLQESNINKAQEAARAASTAMNLYGIDAATAQKFSKDLYEGKSTDPLAKEYYDALVKGTVTPELQQKLLTDAAKKAPDSPYFKANPQDLLYAKPAGDLKRGEETSGQYGNDPKYGFALISKTGGDKALDEKGDVVLSGLQDLRENTSLQYIGADPHSAWQGAFARGTGALGVTASKDEITDFARIEKELNRLGGVQRQVDPDTGSAMDVVYVERKDPESDRTYKVPVTAEQFFRMQLAEKYPAISEEDPSSQARFTRNFTSTSAYDYYKQTKGALDKIATDFYKDPSRVPQYGSIKEAYNDLNDKYKNLYLWQGRTDTLDPEAMKKLGIEDPTANDSHIQVYLEPKGDWLVPKTKKELVDGKIVETPMINPFKFSDPNTTAGVLGDTFNNIMEILAIPPISMALGAYMATGPLAAASQSLGQSVITNLGLDAALANSTMSYAQIAALESAIGSSILNSGIGALPAGVGGDLDKFGRSFLTNLAGSGVQLGSGMLLPEGTPSIVPKALGVATTAGLSNRDLEDVLTRLGQSEGIKTLLSNVPTGDFNTALISAFMPSILSGNLTPQDVVRIAQAVNPPKK